MSQHVVFPQPGALGQGLGGGRQRLGAQAGQGSHTRGPACVCCRITEASMSPSACIQTQFSEEREAKPGKPERFTIFPEVTELSEQTVQIIRPVSFPDFLLW